MISCYQFSLFITTEKRTLDVSAKKFFVNDFILDEFADISIVHPV